MRTVLFAGGGSLGPVTPLLAVAARMRERRPDLRFAWAGTDNGPERELVESAGIHFATVAVAKLPRYLTPKLFTAPFDYMHARRDAGRLLDEAHPALVLSAGGFTAVPVIMEAARRRITRMAHQLDYDVGLSNRMVAKHCRYVTTSFDYPFNPFGHNAPPMYRVPTPVRFRIEDLPSRDEACRAFGFDPSRPVTLVTGGGTGAKMLNDVVYGLRSRLLERTQVLHLTGLGKINGMTSTSPDYVIRDLLKDEMLQAYAVADVVVSRAGVGAIAELAALKKAAILVPLPDSPQESNAHAMRRAVDVIHHQDQNMSGLLLDAVTRLLDHPDERVERGEMLHDLFPTDHGEILTDLALSVLV